MYIFSWFRALSSMKKMVNKHFQRVNKEKFTVIVIIVCNGPGTVLGPEVTFIIRFNMVL